MILDEKIKFVPGILFEFFSKCKIYKNFKRNEKIHNILLFWIPALILMIFTTYFCANENSGK